MEIRHLHNGQIRRELWDQAVKGSLNGKIYNLSWYLDAISPGWHALVADNYRMVMPLTWRKKYGISYLCQPLLSQQAGIISGTPVAPEQVLEFLTRIPARFKLAEITLNFGNPVVPGPFWFEWHTTYLLNLNRPYGEIATHYSVNHRRNIRKASEQNLFFTSEVHQEEYLALLEQDQSHGSQILLSARNKPLLIRLISAMIRQRTGIIFGTRSPDGTLVAAVLTGIDRNVLYYLAPAMTGEGHERRAMFHLVDRVIDQYAGQEFTLDFEGSDIENVARFYKGFGPAAQSYPSLRYSRLPAILKTLAPRRFR
ncbi:MAG: GNAT family N-acetyltransferase [Bacteroidales bacterium]